MVRLVTRADLAPLLTESSSIAQSLDVIREALAASLKPSPEHQSWLAYPLGSSEAKVHVNLLASPSGTSVRVFPPPDGPTVATGDSLGLMFDDDGRVQAIVDLHDLGSWRTAAPVAVACAALAPEDAGTLALIGSGTEARSLLVAVRVAMPALAEARVYSRTPAHRRAFAEQWTSTQLPVRAVSDSREAVEGADIVCVAAGGGRPLFQAGWVRAGALVTTIGWGTVPDDLRARTIVPLFRFNDHTAP